MDTIIGVEPPSPQKLALIRDFMRVSGLQAKVDHGQMAREAAARSGRVFNWQLYVETAPKEMLFSTFVSTPEQVFFAVYKGHRGEWQWQYENHIHQTYSDEELIELTRFFSSPVGQRLVDDDWRMNAYIRTNTEELADQIVDEIVERLRDPETWRSALRSSGPA